MLDCVIIGGGPAGLSAALYLARFRLDVRLIDAGQSRTGLIPRTRNQPAFPDGIPGAELLARMRKSLESYGVAVEHGEATRITAGEVFAVHTTLGRIEARTVLLATGVTDRQPDMPPALHAEALAKGRLRYCPICDGHEVIDRKVGVLGTGEHGAREALFLRTYTADLSLVAPERHALSAEDRAKLEAAGIAIVDGPARGYALEGEGIAIETGDGRLRFHSLYPALGFDAETGLAQALGAALAEHGCIRVDAHMRTNVPGLYAAGDIVIGVDQIARAVGHGAIAATAIRNDLKG